MTDLLDHRGRGKTKGELTDELFAEMRKVARKEAIEAVRDVVEHYFTQIPDVVERMLRAGFAHNGLSFEMPPPPPPAPPTEKLENPS